MTRFFVDPADFFGSDTLMLTGENAAHARVLRLAPGEEVAISDGNGNEAVCQVVDCGNKEILLKVRTRGLSSSEAKVKVTVYMAFSKADKLEHVIQKATELGAYEIIAFPSSRCVSRPDAKSLGKKLERWQKIALSAAEQSGRGYIPKVIALDSYSQALERALEADLPILLYENEHATTLKMALEEKDYSSVALISGPEGGLEAQEVERASDLGVHVCTLGRRILRCETAPLCALSAVMYASGEF